MSSLLSIVLIADLLTTAFVANKRKDGMLWCLFVNFLIYVMIFIFVGTIGFMFDFSFVESGSFFAIIFGGISVVANLRYLLDN